ncbi:acyl-CoA dehydrogenase family protein [Sphingomonas sp.]|uniref:acyl-CoA dehydrogenase family protein n=1 Tax=Sphingomonas sp. TaxID=28214 RepID=UPI002DD62B07|nr:acyl-CoA dehydrogenase family protein [Sphingomonas sp.]
MDLSLDENDEAFRREVREYIAQNLPEDTREWIRLGRYPRKSDSVAWQRIMNRRGWATPGWPKEHGGGLGPMEKLILAEENYLGWGPEPIPFNSWMLGPILAHFGSDEQKREFLPKLADADIWFCQGFSEPGSGSDLASLKTSAVRDGDHYVVNGQKIWTSTAHVADWIFCLVRTDPAAKPQRGISFLLIDLKTPGITVRPIHSMDRHPHLNEVFFDNVRVPVENLVGEENQGWTYARFLLGHERVGIARLGKIKERLRYAIERARAVQAGGRPLIEDSRFRERIADLQADLRMLEVTQLRLQFAESGDPDGSGTSMLKIRGAELQQAVYELIHDIAGPAGLEAIDVEDTPVFDTDDTAWPSLATSGYLLSRAISLYGGSDEIQRNIIARSLGLQ